MLIRKSAHAAYRTEYHVVWCTRFRRKILVEGVQKYLKIKIEETRKYYPDWEYKAIGFDSDHVHLFMVIPPKYSVAFVVETIKKNTSRRLKEKYKFLKEVYWDDGGIWAVGYFVSTVGINEAIIRNYVLHQGKEDSGQAELEI